MIYDDMNIYYNYIMKKVCKVRLLSNRQVYSSPNKCIHLPMSLLLFFKCYEFLHGIEKNRLHCKGEFYKGNIQNCLWTSSTVCVDVDVKV